MTEPSTEPPCQDGSIPAMGPPPLRQSLTLECRIDDLVRIPRWFEEACSFPGLPSDLLFDLMVCAYEAAANIILYGYDNPKGHAITLEFARSDDVLVLSIEDDGRPFNPLERPEPPAVSTIADAPISGRGILLIRRLSDGLEYSRAAQYNRLVIRRNLVPRCEPCRKVQE
ncbi:MAG: hypothetical protein GC191_18080 [Azospirillum sp.]|nr:hypothetical protein [Azospirillum sp.]